MSRQDSRQPRNLDVADMRGLYLLAVRQINREGLASDLFINNINAVHYENGHCASVGDGMVACNCDCADDLIRRSRRR